MKNTLYIIILLTSLSASLSGFSQNNELSTSNEVGSLPGSFSVNSNGAAVYTIPLTLPEGRGALKPTLSINYNSQAGNGLLGIRCNLGGLSSISRSATNLYFEGYIDGVDFDNNDKFSLNGERILPVDEFSSSYRTENESYAKIVAHGPDQLDPDWFEVFTKDGRIIEYGKIENGNNAQIIPVNKNSTLIWQVSRIKDRSGNYIDYYYDNSSEPGKIKKILYTGNIETNSDPFYCVDFIYEPREDNSKQYISGGYTELNSLLKQITVSYESNSIESFTIDYSTDMGFPKISNISVSDKNDISLNPTVFEYYVPGNIFDLDMTNINNNENKVDYSFGDFNGDGNTDIITAYYTIVNGAKEYTTSSLFESTGDGINFVETELLTLPQNFMYFISGDYNGDGIDDIVMVKSSSYILYQRNPDGSYTASATIQYNGEILSGYGQHVGFFDNLSNVDWGHNIAKNTINNIDINGNGIAEILHVNYNLVSSQNKIIIRAYEYNSATGNFDDIIYRQLGTGPNYDVGHISDYYDNYNDVTFGDYNGDGKTDLLLSTSATTSTILELNDNAQLNQRTMVELNPNGYSFPSIEDWVKYSGDFNGDGITDLFTVVNGMWSTKLFNGKDGWIDGVPISIPEPPHFSFFDDYKHGLADFNGDGKTDILQVYQEYYFDPHTMNEEEFIASHWDIHYSTGVGFIKEEIVFSEENPVTCTNDGPVFIDINGDGKSECLMKDTPGGNTQVLFFHKDDLTYNIEKITNGLGLETIIDYEPITNESVYEKGNSFSYPLIDIQYPLYVVKKLEEDNGQGGFFTKEFFYKGLIVHKQGKGSLGFTTLESTDYRANVFNYSEYDIRIENNLYFHKYLKKATQHPLASNGIPDMESKITELQNSIQIINPSISNNFIYYPVLTESIRKTWDNETENNFVKMETSSQLVEDIDSYGNSTKSMVTISTDESGSFFSETIYEASFINNLDIANWLVNRPDYTKVITNYYDDEKANEIYTEYTYYQQGNQGWPLVELKKNTPNSSDLHAISELYEYNLYGNITKKSTIAYDLSVDDNPPLISKAINFGYSDDNNYNGRFLTSITQTNEGVEYTQVSDFNLDDGTLNYSIDASGLTTQYHYGNFGRLEYVTFPDNSQQSSASFWVSGSIYEDIAPLNSVYFELIDNPDLSSTIVFKDKLGREIRTIISGIEEDWRGVDKIYSPRGVVSKTSEPYFVPDFPDPLDNNEWTRYIYNSRNNKIGSIITPTNSFSFTYDGLKTTKTNNSTGISKTTILDILGRNTKVTDPAGEILYDYYSNGLLKSINALGNKTTYYYDLAGRQELVEEPNFGAIEYTYGNFGELIKQTDSEDNTYKFTYDNLGRITQKVLVNTGAQTNYTYNSNPGENGFGLISSITNYNGISYIYDYDDYNRLNNYTEVIGGTSYSSSIQYNGFGAVESYTYPTGFTIDYQYSYRGKLERILDGRFEDKIIWELNSSNRRGQITNYELGNGLTTIKDYDDLSGMLKSIKTGLIQDLEYNFNSVTGNLEWRKDHRFELAESFTYDALLNERLETWSVNRGTVYGIKYKNDGNIITKTGITNDSDPQSFFKYGQDAGPHAVTSISNPELLYYENVSNQSISYTAFNKVSQINQTIESIGDPVNLLYKLEYGPDLARKVSLQMENSQIVKTKHYVGSNFELEATPANPPRKLHYINSPDGLIAIFVQNGESDTMYYIQKDHLGSFYCVTGEDGTIVSSPGEVEQVYSFDAWGRQRNPTDWTYTAKSYKGIFDRGYTAHEHLWEFDLINMNGRFYDPRLGRMLSPDPVLQAPEYSQDYNRYSYAFNNPLKYTDPSGYSEYLNQMKMDHDYEGGGFWYRGSYYAYNYETNSFQSDRGSMSGAKSTEYKYDWNTGGYYNNLGERVTFSEVYANYVLPNSSPVDRKDWAWHCSAVNALRSSKIKFLPVIQFPTRNYNLMAFVPGGDDDVGLLYEYSPDWADRWYDRSKKWIVSDITYSFADAVWVTFQSLFLGKGPNAVHINGTATYGNDRTDAFVHTTSWGVLFGEAASFNAIKGGVMSSRHGIRIQAHSHSLSPLRGAGASGTMSPFHININNTHIIVNPKFWKYYYKWWPKN